MQLLDRVSGVGVALIVMIAVLPIPATAQDNSAANGTAPADDSVVISTDPSDQEVDLDFVASTDGEYAVSPVVESTAALIGMTWDGANPADPQFRSRDAAGSWSAWAPLEQIDGAPDGEAKPAASEPVWIGTESTAIQFRTLPGAAAGSKAVLLAPTGEEAAQPDTEVGAGTAAATETTENGITVNLRAAWDDGCRNPDAEVGYAHVRVAVVHHTTGSNTYSAADVPTLVRAICHYHVDTLGWDDIAYNFLVDRFGQVWEGREGGIRMPIRGAHSQGFNSFSAGFALLGEHASSQPSAAALDSLGEIIGWKLWLEGRPAIGQTTVVSLGSALWPEGTKVSLNRISGHRNVQSTSCPGNAAYDDLAAIRSDADDEISSLPKLKASVAGDFNGDGRIDGATLRGNASWEVSLGSWNEIGAPTTWGSSSTASGWDAHVVGDFNGDGRDDIAGYKPSTGAWEVLTSNGSGFTRKNWETYTNPWGWDDHLVGDFNKDGRDDIVSYKPATGKMNVAVSTGSTFQAKTWAVLNFPVGWTERVVGDFNGDGRDDVASYKPSKRRWRVSISNGFTFKTKTWSTFGFSTKWKIHLAGDFNGDGLDDVAQYAPVNGAWRVSTSTGSKFTSSVWTNLVVDNGWARHVVADLTGDGKDDIAQYHPDDRRWVVTIGKASKFTKAEWSSDAPKPMKAGDTGQLVLDGLEDFVLSRPDGSWLGHRSTGAALAIWLP